MPSWKKVAISGSSPEFNHITASGDISSSAASTLSVGTGSFANDVTIVGGLDVDGTTNLDIVDIDGAVDMASTLTLAGNADFNANLDVDGHTDLDLSLIHI